MTAFAKRLLLHSWVTCMASHSLAQAFNFDTLSQRTLTGDSATLRFRMKWENKLSPSSFSAYNNRTVAELKKGWEENGSTPESVASSERQLRDFLSIRKREAQITVSYSGKRFYYSFQPIDGDPRDPQNRKTIVYFNGEKTFRLLDRSVRIASKAEFRDIPYIPLIGVSYAGIPVFRKTENAQYFELQKLSSKPQRADVFYPGTSAGKLERLAPGFVILSKWKGFDVLKTMLSIDNKHPHSRIDFTRYELKFGIPLATRCVIDRYALPPGENQASNEIQSRTEYLLERITSGYNGFDASEMLKMLRTGDALAIEGADGTTEHLMMNPKSWETQKYFIEDGESSPMWRSVAVGGICSAAVFVTWQGVRTLRKGK